MARESDGDEEEGRGMPNFLRDREGGDVGGAMNTNRLFRFVITYKLKEVCS